MIGQARLAVSGFLTVVALLATACSSGAARPHPSLTSATSAAGAAGGPETQSPAPVTMADAQGCPVTLPRSAGPPGVSEAFFGWGSSYGNGKLWVGGLWPHGVIVARKDFVEPDGSVRMKFGWWRKVSGRLNITGRRLDAPAPRADWLSGQQPLLPRGGVLGNHWESRQDDLDLCDLRDQAARAVITMWSRRVKAACRPCRHTAPARQRFDQPRRVGLQ
jgi:hypothetical protein